jgi:mono/diheme cytochrome c family protein
MTRRVAPLLLLAALATAGCQREAATPPANVSRAAPPGVPAETGENIYLTACANCHGADGRGAALKDRFPELPDLGAPEVQAKLTDDTIAETIRQGHGKMPGFTAVLSEDQISRLPAYLRGLKR